MPGSAGAKGAVFASEWRRFADASTELEVIRLTGSAHSSILPAYYNRAVSRNSAFLVFSTDRAGAMQAFRMDLRSGETRQLTQAEELDGSSLTLLPDNRGVCYFAGRRLCLANLTTLAERVVYTVEEEWERCAGMSVNPDGAHAIFAERQGGRSRIRVASLTRGGAITAFEAPFEAADPIARPGFQQILYRQADAALWLANSDGSRNRRLALAPGRVGPADWAPDGGTALYLNFPEDHTQLNAIREYVPEEDADKLVGKTSQYVHFGFNRNTSVFVGASRNAASPAVLIMLRLTRRELTLCEHRASRPETVAPIFSPDAQRVLFQSDRAGKPAIYSVRVERLVEKIQEGGV